MFLKSRLASMMKGTWQRFKIIPIYTSNKSHITPSWNAIVVSVFGSLKFIRCVIDWLILRFQWAGFFPPQLKSLFQIFTFVSERNIKYQYLILASLILVACIGIVLDFLVQ